MLLYMETREQVSKKNRESYLPMSLTDICLDPVFSFIPMRRWFCSSHSYRSFIFFFSYFDSHACSINKNTARKRELARVIALEYVRKNDYISIFISPIAGHCSATASYLSYYMNYAQNMILPWFFTLSFHYFMGFNSATMKKKTTHRVNWNCSMRWNIKEWNKKYMPTYQQDWKFNLIKL